METALPHTTVSSTTKNNIPLCWIVTGLLIIAIHILLAILSQAFSYERPLIEKPVLVFVAIELAAGIVFLVQVSRRSGAAAGSRLFVWMIAVGAIIRLTLFASTPVLEDDFYRYLWDGAVIAHGQNPYKYSPKDIIKGEKWIPHELGKLAVESRDVITRINHKWIRTIYPPVAQAAFTVSYVLKPWSITAWRVVLLLFDAASLLLLLRLLKELKLPAITAAVYWCNPLLALVTYNSMHMDVILFPFLIGAVLFSIRRKYLMSVFLLALSVGVKVWPLILLPLLLRPVFRNPRKLIVALCLFIITLAVLLIPVFLGGFGKTSGFTVYLQKWENNDSLFLLAGWLMQFAAGLFGAGPEAWMAATRIFIGAILIALVAWLSRKTIRDGNDLCERCLLVIAALFLVSPTQFPWYFAWLLPLLAVRPRFSLLLLTALLPLYYLQYYLEPREMTDWFRYGIVWLEFVPVWILLIREHYAGRLKINAGRGNSIK